MSESKTPRSDEANKKWAGNYHHCCVDVDFARSLELELNEASAEVNNLLPQVQAYRDAEIKNPLARSESIALKWMNRALSAESQLTTAQQELKTLKLKCGLCICPEHTTDQACISCVTEQPNVFQQLEHAQQEIEALKEKLK